MQNQNYDPEFVSPSIPCNEGEPYIPGFQTGGAQMSCRRIETSTRLEENHQSQCHVPVICKNHNKSITKILRKYIYLSS